MEKGRDTRKRGGLVHFLRKKIIHIFHRRHIVKPSAGELILAIEKAIDNPGVERGTSDIFLKSVDLSIKTEKGCGIDGEVKLAVLGIGGSYAWKSTETLALKLTPRSPEPLLLPGKAAEPAEKPAKAAIAPGAAAGEMTAEKASPTSFESAIMAAIDQARSMVNGLYQSPARKLGIDDLKITIQFDISVTGDLEVKAGGSSKLLSAVTSLDVSCKGKIDRSKSNAIVIDFGS